MIQGLLWIVGSYGLCALLVHMFHARLRKDGGAREPRVYVLITHNNQHQVEWYIRSLVFYSLFKGKDIHITVLDEGSEDETVEIVRKLMKHRCIELRVFVDGVELERYIASLDTDEAVYIRLYKQADHRNVPLLQ